MRTTKSNSTAVTSENLVRDIRRATRKHHAAEEKIRITRTRRPARRNSIAELCRREGIAESMYYSWSKEFLEAGKRRLAGDTARAATTDEVKQLRREQNGYRPQFYFRTTDVTGVASLPAGTSLVMPGDNINLEVELIAPIAMEKGVRFAIREGGRTVGAGTVTDIVK